VTRAHWTWRDTRAIRGALLRILREPLTVPTSSASRLSRPSTSGDSTASCAGTFDAGNIVRTGPFRHGATYVVARERIP
jgi:hypothetical protein